MPRTMQRLGFLARLLMLTGPLALSAQRSSPSASTRVDGESSAEFTRLHSAVELRDGLVVVVDILERTASVITFRDGAVRAFARTGAGPREIGLPWRLVSLGGDSAAIIDAQHARALVVRPDGSPGAFVQTPGAPGMETLGPRASTARVLGARTLVAEGRRGDTLTVMRVGSDGRARVIAALRRPPAEPGRQAVRMGGAEVERRMDPNGGNANPFPYPNELWEASPDGWVVIVSRDPYRVSWITTSGERVDGPVYAVEARAISTATRDSLAVEHVRELPALVAARTGRYRWPATVPAFAVGRTPTVFIDPRGRAWVRRLHLAEEPPLYDVFDRTGRRVRQVHLEGTERLVGFGNRHLLVAVRDADDAEFVRRVRFTY